LSGIFAAVAALLAAIGIYGMMSGSVTERRREFGIRLALGAEPGAVLAMVMRTAVFLAAFGIVAGFGGAALLRRFVESRLFGISGLDPATLGSAAVAILALTVVASLVPAIRATRIDPVRSLRVE
jgi:putative ABC transport system permease protein